MNESEITCMYLKRTMMERLCAISESGASKGHKTKRI